MKHLVWCLTLGLLLIAVARQANATLIINGDFETGTLAGWTTFTTANGTLGTGFPNVVPFDTNNDGTATNSAQFRVGQVSFDLGVPAGGGIFQNITTGAAPLTLGLDIAALSPDGPNSGGLFELLLDGSVIDSFDFGDILAGATEFSMLAALQMVSAGTHEVRIRMTRLFLQGGGTPEQYLDNIIATQAAPVPEPSTMLLLGSGLAGLGYFRRRRKAA